MKIKLLRYMFVLAIIMTGAIGFAGCGGNKELSYTEVTIGNAQYKSYQGDQNIGDYSYGDTINLNYTVRAVYLDSSKKDLTSSDYTVAYKFKGNDISSLPQTFEIGDYTIIITYQDTTCTLHFNVNPATKTYTTVVQGNKVQWTYGQAQPTIGVSDSSIVFDVNNNPYRYIEKSRVADPSAITELEVDASYSYDKDMLIKPGEYYVFTIVPATGNYAESVSSLREIRINKAALRAEIDGEAKATYTYSGYTLGKVKLGEVVSMPIITGIKDINNEIVQIVNWGWAEPNKEVDYSNNGDTVLLTFEFSDTVDWDWNDYYILPSDMSCELEIVQGQLQKANVVLDPFSTGAGLQIYVGEVGVVTNYPYWNCYKVMLGSSEIELTGDDTVLSIATPTDPGTYTYTISLKDKVNYTWQDGTNEDIVCSIVIE